MVLRNIQNKCQEKGMTIAELERKAGLKQRTIYKWDESVPSIEKVLAVANALETTVEELAKKEGE